MIARLCAVLVSLVLVAPAASAQVIRRDRPSTDAKDEKKDEGDKAADEKKAEAKPGDDDDILAPAATDKPADKKPADAPAVKAENAVKVGLVSLVPVGEASKVTADQVTAALLKELQASKALDVSALAVDVEGGAKKSADDDAAAKAALIDGDDKLKKGRAFLEKNQLGKARAGFEGALAAFEKAAPVLADSAPLFFAQVGLAEVAARQGQDDESAAWLAKASVMMPELELDAKAFPAQFIRTHQKVRQKAMQEPRGTIVVDASGAGAAVQLDGRETAGAPVRILEVPAGRHLVRAVREGLPAWGALVEVAAGAEVSVSPGFLAKDGKSWFDALAQNRFDAGAAEQVKRAAAAAGHKATLVGVVGKNGGQVPVQLVYVDARGFAALPPITFQSDLLDVSIESLPARERAEELAHLDKAPAGTFVTTLDAVLAGAQAGAAAKVAEVKMRYDVKAAPAEKRASRVVGAEETGKGVDDPDGRSVLAAGKSGTRQRLEDEDDPYGEQKPDPIADPDAPITDQPWFWPAVIGGAAGVVVLAGGVTVLALIGLKVIPDPRPADKGEVHVTLP